MQERIFNVFNTIETNYPVNKWNVFDVDVWPFIRISLSFKLLTMPATKRVGKRNVDSDLNGHIPSLSSLYSLDESVDAFILFDPIRRIKLNNYWYSRLSGPFNEELKKKGYNVIDLEYHANNVKRFPVLHKAYSVSNQSDFCKINSILYKPSQLEKYEQVKQVFLKEFRDKVDFPTLEHINDTALYIQKMSQIFELLFLKKKTKFAFSVIFYHPQCYAFTLAARRMGIPSVDIQHGIGGWDPSYKQWCNVPCKGYNIMPNYFWCWDKDSEEIITSWSAFHETHKTINGGNPWVELWRDDKNPLVKKYDYLMDEFISKDHVNILISLQPLKGTYGWDTNIPEWVIKAIDESPKNYKWFIRYHPQMVGNYSQEIVKCEEKLRPFILTGKVETSRSTEEPLMAILKKMTVHITPLSTSVIEAIYADVPSITIHKEGLLAFHNEISAGWVTCANSTKKLLFEIENISKKRGEKKYDTESSGSVGLSRGLDTIINSVKKSRYSVSLLNTTRIQKKIYLSDRKYGKIIDDYEKEPKVDESFIAGKAYEMLGQTENALKCYSIYLDNIISFYEEYELQVDDLIQVREFYQSLLLDSTISELDTILLKLILENTHHQDRFFEVLFQRGHHSLVMKWMNYLKSSLDTSYYIGRSLLLNGEFKLGIEKLIDYLKMYDLSTGRTKKQNFKSSAHFHLGKVFLEQNKFDEAMKHLEKSNNIEGGRHLKAKQYMKKIEKSLCSNNLEQGKP